ncbi:MAG: ATP-binding protein, partial [Solirubrobacteraceae bacterium]
AVRQEGAVVGYVVSARNIGPELDRELHARDRDRQLDDALSIAGYGRFTWHVASDRLTPDSDIAQVLRLEPGTIQGSGAFRTLLERVHPSDRSRVDHAVREATRPGGAPLNVRFWFLPPGREPGAEIRISAIAHCHDEPWNPDAGDRRRLVGVIADITDAHREEQARIRQQKVQALGTLAGGVAHDFNNVISAILSYATLAERQLASGDSALDSISEISRGAQRAGDLSRRLLAFSRAETRRTEWFDLADVVREGVALVRPMLAHHAQLELEIASDLPPALGDPSQLHQVVVNLLTNAVHALSESGGGTVQVLLDHEITHAEPGDADLGALRLRVVDDGPGIPTEIAPRIFDPFFTTKSAERGTGLGLAAVRGIVDAHDGTVAVSSRPSFTTTFTVRLPIRAVPQA